MADVLDRIESLPVYTIKRVTTDEERTYESPEGVARSVTTIIDATEDKQRLEEWRESVGYAVADEIRDLAAFRGTKLHEWVERYLLTREEPPFDFLVTLYWRSIIQFLPRVEHTILMEAPVWHPDGFAGTPDCLAYLDDDLSQPTLLDWKTADKPCKPQKIYRYSLQLAAYVRGLEHVYKSFGLHIPRAVLVVAKPGMPPEIHEFDRNALDQLYDHFLARLQHFVRSR